jgi:hypothetical protein
MARPTRRRDPFRDGQTTTVTVVGQAAVELNYDYNRLPEEERAAVQRAARIIKPLLRRTAEDIFVIGDELGQVKARLPHGRYTEWLGMELGLSERMAQHFVNVRGRLGPKSEKFSVLPPSTLYLLAAPSTPDEAIAEVEAQLEREGSVSVSAVQRVIAAAKARALAGEMMAGAAADGAAAGDAALSAARRLERALTEAILLLSGQAGRDWALLFGDGDEGGELVRVRREAAALREAVRRRTALSP